MSDKPRSSRQQLSIPHEELTDEEKQLNREAQERIRTKRVKPTDV